MSTVFASNVHASLILLYSDFAFGTGLGVKFNPNILVTPVTDSLFPILQLFTFDWRMGHSVVAAEAESFTTLAHDCNYFTKSTLCCLGATFAWTPFDALRLLVNERIYVNSIILLKIRWIGQHLLEYPLWYNILTSMPGTRCGDYLWS